MKKELTMATFPTITLNGNTTTTWTNQGGGITNHEVFAFTLQHTSPENTTGVLLSDVTVFINPTRYNCTVAVKGPQAVSGNFESNGV
jgi:hypothetical protein